MGAIVFNSDEIFTIGIEIEKNGQKFYQGAVKKFSETSIKKVLQELADWEEKHIHIFEDLAKQSQNFPYQNPLGTSDDEVKAYLKAAADSHVFVQNSNIESLIAKCESIQDIFKLAIQFEKDSVVFYSSMMTIVPDYLGKKELEKIVVEELRHIAILSEKQNHL